MALVKIKSRRMHGVHVVKPFIYGSTAFWLGRSAKEKETHRWSIYVRGLEHEDLSYFIKSVTFHLHPSFENPVRVLEKPPFELTEHGWGEFTYRVKVHFHDSREQPIELTHTLQLFPANKSDESTKTPVMSEVYDEFVFAEPNEVFYKLLQTVDNKRLESKLQPWFDQSLIKIREQEKAHLEQLHRAQEAINRRLDAQREMLHDVQVEIAHYRSVT